MNSSSRPRTATDLASSFVLLASLVIGGTVPMLTQADHHGQKYRIHGFEKIHVSPHFWSEGANFGDFNRDGVMDVVSGPFWYAGPEFTAAHEYTPADRTFETTDESGRTVRIPGFEGALGKKNTYSDNFFAFSHDFNGDDWTDILILGFPGRESSWYENPRGRAGHWQRHIVLEVTDNESPTFADLTGDGTPEIVCGSGGYYGYAAPVGDDASRPWRFHRITPKGKWQRFTHGLGIGDVNGDGRKDLLESGGWWEQPASLEGDPEWTHHPFTFGTGGAQMFAYDVDADGDNDVITSLTAHGYGLAWYEQIQRDGSITFEEHIFMNKEPEENRYGVQFSQLHAVDLVDMDQDGVMDILTGKRFWAHGPTGDPEPNKAPVLYWFRLVRGDNGDVDFVPYQIDDASGVGTQAVARDINGDGYPEIVIGNKRGTFVFRHQVRNVSKEAWLAAQPKRLH